MSHNTTGGTAIGITTYVSMAEPYTSTTTALSSAILESDRIAVDANVLNGEPYIQGTRVPIAAILDSLAEGATPKELIEDFPRLTLDDIWAAVDYAAAKALWSGK